ncbi:MAG: glycosyltransferase [Clostridium sp.]
MEKIIFFGASLFCTQVINFFKEEGFIIEAIFDNDEKKWGKTHCGIEVKSPRELENYKNIKIIITSMYFEEIYKQIKSLNSEINIFNAYDLISDKFDEKNIEQNQIEKNGDWNLVIGTPRGLEVIGGIETWTLNFKEAIKNDVGKIYDFNNKKFVYENIQNENRISKLIEEYEKELPLIIIPNFCEDLYLMGIILKKKYGDLVQVISTVHSDTDIAYKQQMRYEKYIDKFLCVSDEICKNLKKILERRDKDICVALTSVKFEENQKFDKFKLVKENIDIVYVGRLEYHDKRVDKLIDLYHRLKKKNIKFNLNLIGEGSYKKKLEENLKFDNVKFYGWVNNQEIYSVLKTMDIFLNTSDLEGTSVAMLEALANGLTPIVTNVSGVDKFIEHNKNGYIVEKNDMESMVKYINKIYEERLILEGIYEKNRKIILENCTEKIYREKLFKIIGVWND